MKILGHLNVVEVPNLLSHRTPMAGVALVVMLFASGTSTHETLECGTFGLMSDAYAGGRGVMLCEKNADPINQCEDGAAGANALDLKVVSERCEAGTTNFFPVLTKVIASKPDQIVLSGISPSEELGQIPNPSFLSLPSYMR